MQGFRFVPVGILVSFAAIAVSLALFSSALSVEGVQARPSVHVVTLGVGHSSKPAGERPRELPATNDAAAIPISPPISPARIANPGSAVNPRAYYTAEPAPMGIADFGVTQTGTPYSYTTTSVVGNATIVSLYLHNASSGSTSGSLQLNTVLEFTENGSLYEYWIQDVAFIDTQTNFVQFIDNVWNFSSSGARVLNSTLEGNGVVVNSPGFYYDIAAPNLPGNDINLAYPATILLRVDSSYSPSGEPMVEFSYRDGQGWQTYDQVLFRVATNPRTLIDRGFVVDGRSYNPSGLFNDIELILGGPGGGASTAAIGSQVALSIEFENGANWQVPPAAWNFGSDTAETISNVLDTLQWVSSTGFMDSQVAAASGGLGGLWDNSTTGQLSLRLPGVASGYVWIGPEPTAFSGGFFSTVVKGTAIPYVLEVEYLGHILPTGTIVLAAGSRVNLTLPVLNPPTTSLGASHVGSVSGTVALTYSGTWNWSGVTGSLRLYWGSLSAGALESVTLASGIAGNFSLNTSTYPDGNYSVVFQATTPFFATAVSSANLYFDNLEAKLAAQIIALQSQLSRVNLTLSNARAELQLLNLTITNLSIELSNLTRELGQNSSEVTNLTLQISTLRTELSTLNATVSQQAADESGEGAFGFESDVIYGLGAIVAGEAGVIGLQLYRRRRAK